MTNKPKETPTTGTRRADFEAFVEHRTAVRHRLHDALAALTDEEQDVLLERLRAFGIPESSSRRRTSAERCADLILMLAWPSNAGCIEDGVEDDERAGGPRNP